MSHYRDYIPGETCEICYHMNCKHEVDAGHRANDDYYEMCSLYHSAKKVALAAKDYAENFGGDNTADRKRFAILRGLLESWKP